MILQNSRLVLLLLAPLVFMPAELGAQPAGDPSQPVAALSDAMAQYRGALAEYQSARATFNAVAEAYWRSISEKRHLRSAKRASHEQTAC